MYSAQLIITQKIGYLIGRIKWSNTSVQFDKKGIQLINKDKIATTDHYLSCHLGNGLFYFLLILNVSE